VKTTKIFLAVLLVIMLMAGIALADERRNREGRERRNREPQCTEWQNKDWRDFGKWNLCPMRAGGRRADRMNAREIPQEIREKWAEAQKIAIDLRLELGRIPVDRARALELRAQHRAIVNEISDWHFIHRLDLLTTR